MGSLGPHREDYPLKSSGLRAYLKKMRGRKILVIGDLILDHYVWGQVSRVSPEAPVPVVNVQSETLQLGGAANVSNNIRALGGRVDLCGVIGSDDGGRRFLGVLEGQGIGRDGIMTDRDRPTTRKTRVVAHSQQLVRFDLERREAISGVLEARLSRYVAACIGSASALVVSDYAKGVITPRLMADVIELAHRHGTPVIVDPKVAHIGRYKGATVLTPNHLEAVLAAGLHGDDDATLMEAGRELQQRLGCQAVLITRGERGMSLFESNGRVSHLPTVAQQVFDVTGAGDTVVATLALALAAGASIRHAAMLANHAAGVVVGMVGTGTVTAAQLEEAVAHG
jgi:D-beta-D-heptose 7-phosphate kinase/D-beta-D-heptose 1-phosphate adenosyltransferase